MNVVEFPIRQVPLYVKNVAEILTKAGFQAFLVGGAVRDLILKRTPKDFDIATNATPDQILQLFPQSISTGAKFGNIIVLSEDEQGERFEVDVTTFRKEEEYYGGRWPSKVEFTSDIEEDLSRRDFTINALAIDFQLILNDADQVLTTEQIIDPFNGVQDFQNKIIRAVRNPVERFEEDGLRAFKACRLASELNFKIDEATKNAIVKTKNIASKISMERIRDELVKLLKHSPKPSYGIKLLDETTLLDLIIPELLETKGVVQPEWHKDDVYTHSLKCLDLAEDSVKLAALLHDIGKARTKSVDEDGNTHFYGHDVKGAEMTQEILKRLKFSRKEILRVSNLVRWHMFYYPSADWRKKEKETEEHKHQHGWSDGAIRRFIKNIGGVDQLDDLIKLRIADAASNPHSSFDEEEIKKLQQRVSEVISNDMIIKITDLEINGHDLIEMGVPAGPDIRKILNKLLDLVIEEPHLNTKDRLLEIARNELNKN